MKMEKELGLENIFGKTVPLILVNSLMVNLMVMDKWVLQMEIYMKENGRTDNCMV